MKIAFTGINIPEGKIKYQDPIVLALTEQVKPDKVATYFFEFLKDDYEHAEAIVITRDAILDLLVNDIEKLENRIERSEDEAETAILKRGLEHVENEQPLCDMPVDDSERAILAALAPFSFKPTLVLDSPSTDTDELGHLAMEKAGVMFFYTAGKQEVHAWFTECNTSAVDCAAKIHSDLARGFIKAEIISFEQFATTHSMQDARSKDLTTLVGRDHVIEPETVLEIRFNV
jgi:ribosome-binding ATPase YchF (GTP1/OBG family)